MASKQSEAVKDVWTSWTEAAVDVPPRRTLTRHTNPTEDGKETEMIRLSVFYPATDGATFDHDYYREKHVPLVVQSWGLDGAEIDRGVNGPYVAAVHFRFDSVDALNAARASPGTAAVLADVANYTTIQPVLQTSEIVD